MQYPKRLILQITAVLLNVCFVYRPVNMEYGLQLQPVFRQHVHVLLVVPHQQSFAYLVLKNNGYWPENSIDV
ncbi:hypothetical protein D3C73_1426510 [compost metagenome]